MKLGLPVKMNLSSDYEDVADYGPLGDGNPHDHHCDRY